MSSIAAAPTAGDAADPRPGSDDRPVGPVTCEYRPRTPIDLRQTLGILGRGTYDQTTIWDAKGVWRTFRTPVGPVTLRLEQRPDGVDAAAWGPGAEWVIGGVPELLGAGDDWSALDVARYPFLAEVLRRRQGMRLPRTRRVLEALAPAIIEQKVTSLEAYREWARIVRWYGEIAPGVHEGFVPRDLRVCPSAHTLRHVPSWEWHRLGVDPNRSRTLVLASRSADSLERIVDDGGADAAAKLRTISGIGVWTAAETLQRSHGDPDQISLGDYGLSKTVGFALTGSPTDDDGMLELLEPWAGQRQRVVRLILASGRAPARRAPRATITDHRWR
ncbi:DNA-3-methyladenine glycosylase 2 family protein [Planctomonas sp. JC2975]|uniref:DNA-3-methyladenine glycosylase family protein n=1 Tax=Planctomonas sp. JC2975 TaxID=2729626 RepID=UPI00197B107C|nr:DNA-3-methyladenine glycosylase 2 family protein [Planctomonas sp. JC2975]